jgi:hypothetical protein
MVFIFTGLLIKAQQIKSYQELSTQIFSSEDDHQKKLLSSNLINLLKETLELSEELVQLDSTALLKELISNDQQFQLITWGIELDETWVYFGIIKSYNQLKRKYEIHILSSSQFEEAHLPTSSQTFSWPEGIYLDLIERTWNKEHYYTFFIWKAPDNRTAFKFIEVMKLDQEGKVSFGQEQYFIRDHQKSERVVFQYNRQSHFILKHGQYRYTLREWNPKKNNYEIIENSDYLIVFDHLIPMYPHKKQEMPEFMVPAGNIVDSYRFEKGKWIYIADIDARNLETKDNQFPKPELDLMKKE